MIIRGANAIKKPIQTNEPRIEETRINLQLVGASAAFRSLPSNLRFSMLDGVPERHMQKEARDPGMEWLVEAVMLYARELWEEGI